MIGIDPGSVVTGICVWDAELQHIVTLIDFESHCEALFWLDERLKKLGLENSVLYIEDARLSKLSYGYWGKAGREMGVGYVKALSKDWEKFAQLKGVSYRKISPLNNKTKMPADQFEKLTGIKTSAGAHHVRDAANLVIGRKFCMPQEPYQKAFQRKKTRRKKGFVPTIPPDED